MFFVREVLLVLQYVYLFESTFVCLCRLQGSCGFTGLCGFFLKWIFVCLCRLQESWCQEIHSKGWRTKDVVKEQPSGSVTKTTYGCLYFSLVWTCWLWLDTGSVLMRFDLIWGKCSTGILTEMTHVCVYFSLVKTCCLRLDTGFVLRRFDVKWGRFDEVSTFKANIVKILFPWKVVSVTWCWTQMALSVFAASSYSNRHFVYISRDDEQLYNTRAPSESRHIWTDKSSIKCFVQFIYIYVITLNGNKQHQVT